MRLAFLPLWAVLGVATIGCGDDPGGGGGDAPFPPPEPLSPLTRAPLTTEERIAAVTPQAAAQLDPRRAEDVEVLLEEGYGDVTIVAGEPVTPRTLDGEPPPAPGPGATMVGRFVHLADIQLADDESPARVANLDSAMGLTGGAFRAQEGHECRILNAAVRTINKVHETSPIDVVILGGDNADNAQANEIEWVTRILSGAESIECDSGEDDDPVEGPENDPKDPFFAEGLVMPWIWVMGNHDLLNQGNFRVADKAAEAVGAYAELGSRDWSQPYAPVVTGEWIADERRKLWNGSETLGFVASEGDGHGVTPEAVAAGRAHYTYDLPGSPVRFVVLDTAAPTGGAEGLLRDAEVEGFLRDALDAALDQGKLVIVTSHHASGLLTDGGSFGGIAQDDAVLTDEFRDVLGSYPNILMHLAGHTHHHKLQRIEPAVGYPYWEVETAALADFPHQMRVIEVFDQGNGFYSLRMVALDYQTENDPVAAEGRALGVIDHTSGWQGDGSGLVTDRNVELWVPVP